MKPVEIEYLMRDKLTPGLEKAGQSAESLGDKAERVSKSLTDRIALLKDNVKYAENYLKNLKAQYDRMGPGKAQLEMKSEIDACTKALYEDKIALSALEEEHRKNSTSTKRLSMELRELLDAMARMRLEGKQNTREYQDMASKAATLSDTIGDLRTQTNILAHDDAGLQGVMSGVSGLSDPCTKCNGYLHGVAAGVQHAQQRFRFPACYSAESQGSFDCCQYETCRVPRHIECSGHRIDGDTNIGVVACGDRSCHGVEQILRRAGGCR